MSLEIAGAGWITPLGGGLSEVWQQLCHKKQAEPLPITDPIRTGSYQVFRVPNESLQNLPSHPRLRRASPISRFAAAAGLAALQDAEKYLGPIPKERTALLFAIGNGGVAYTKRFFHDIASSGAQSASPLLFPETVFNAPASHLAAILGIEGATYTIVGDGVVGLSAMKMASDILETDVAEYCLVVGAEEADWLLCDAYHRWRLLRPAPPIELWHSPPRGTILSEGAGAVLLAGKGKARIEATAGGAYFASRARAAAGLHEVARALSNGCPSLVIGGANGTHIDAIEAAAVAEVFRNDPFYSVKPALGESVGAAGLWQIIAALHALENRCLPPTLRPGNSDAAGPELTCSQAVVLGCGLNQQVAGVRLTL